MKDVMITTGHIELFKLLKLEGMAASGGEAKSIIAEGHVLVNGEVETRKRKKIVSGDIVEFGSEKVRVLIETK